MIDHRPKEIFKLVAEIPRGKVMTYKILACRAGMPGAARAVGSILNKNERLVKIPCHRVVKSDGKIGGYKLGGLKKMKLLKSEGVLIKKGRIVDLFNYLHKF